METGYTHNLADDFDVRGENTAAVAVPATPKSEEGWAEIWLGADSGTASGHGCDEVIREDRTKPLWCCGLMTCRTDELACSSGRRSANSAAMPHAPRRAT